MSIEDQALETLQSQTEPIAVVVEDDQIIVTLLEHLLSRRGFDVRIALDGRQATDLVDTLPSPPALVLLDVMLPYLDGFEIIKKIREHDTWKHVPIIMLTAKSQEQNIVRALDHGANDYLIKPFRPEELLARIRRVTKLS
ncbi:MAG TPA: response regulator [Pyrinomonadaceae bacterium]|nr:response regulator [Pyrinomonadaceae bacterium]